MSIFGNGGNPYAGKWYCPKCHTWCTNQVSRCSLCGTAKPIPPPTTEVKK